jgi:hypothetical protein
VPTGSRG